MNRHRYDPERAEALLPLLGSITREIRERSQAIDRLEQDCLRLRRTRTDRQRRSDSEAELAVHRRELRVAQRELERLGCALDDDHPLRVLIPGADGELEHGWAWDPRDGTLESFELASR